MSDAMLNAVLLSVWSVGAMFWYAVGAWHRWWDEDGGQALMCLVWPALVGFGIPILAVVGVAAAINRAVVSVRDRRLRHERDQESDARSIGYRDSAAPERRCLVCGGAMPGPWSPRPWPPAPYVERACDRDPEPTRDA